MISSKKVIICLRISKESITFAYELQNIHANKDTSMRTLTQNIISIIIRLRLQQVGGSDKVCV